MEERFVLRHLFEVDGVDLPLSNQKPALYPTSMASCENLPPRGIDLEAVGERCKRVFVDEG